VLLHTWGTEIRKVYPVSEGRYVDSIVKHAIDSEKDLPTMA
jgi:hypothetical protein